MAIAEVLLALMTMRLTFATLLEILAPLLLALLLHELAAFRTRDAELLVNQSSRRLPSQRASRTGTDPLTLALDLFNELLDCRCFSEILSPEALISEFFNDRPICAALPERKSTHPTL